MFISQTLHSGSLILIVSPAFQPDLKELDDGIQALQRSGFQVELSPNCKKNWGSFAGSDQERLEDFQWALNHPSAKAIVCSRGGYGSSRLFRQLDFDGFRSNPKWLIGFSDVTILHARMQMEGFASIHGPMVVDYSRLSQLTACMKQQDLLLKGLALKYEVTHSLAEKKPEDFKTILVGGNLSLLSYLEPELPEEFFNNRILFLEEVGEAYHKIDRMIDGLFRSGKLAALRAVVLGSFGDCPQNNFPLNPAGMIREKAGINLPVFEGLPCGHANPSLPLMLGYPTEICKEKNNWFLKQACLPLISLAD